MAAERAESATRGLTKCPTGIEGFDEIAQGGLPRGRPTLVCGGPGCGKTLLAMEFLLHGILDYNEPGVFMAFEERGSELTANLASLGYDLAQLIAEQRLFVDEVAVGRADIGEVGAYGLEALLVRLQRAIDTVGARRVAIDGLECFFAGFSLEKDLRAELGRLCQWLKSKDVTAIITGESGRETLTGQGLQEYVSDCVISLDNRVIGQLSTRRLRVVKYRGSAHGANEYPFMIGTGGLSVLPITSLGVQDEASTERISTGIAGLDEMLGGQGCFRGSSILVSGTAGSGKSSLAVLFAQAACRRGEKVLYFAFEESPAQIIRNMRSIGVDLQRLVDQGLLRFHAVRPTASGLEQHLVSIWREVRDFSPAATIFDPVTALVTMGPDLEVKATLTQMMLTRIIDFMKGQGVTTVCTTLTTGQESMDTNVDVSLLMDTWILLQDIEAAGERNRGLYVLKSRGTAHSNQIREYIFSDQGIDLVEPYFGSGQVLTGSARLSQEARDRAEQAQRGEEGHRRQREVDRKRAVMEAQVAALRAQFEAEEDELIKGQTDDKRVATIVAADRQAMTVKRGETDKSHELPLAA